MNAHLQAAPVNSSCVHAQLCIPASATLVKTRASTRHVHSSIQSKALHADIHIHKSCSFAHAHAHTHTHVHTSAPMQTHVHIHISIRTYTHAPTFTNTQALARMQTPLPFALSHAGSSATAHRRSVFGAQEDERLEGSLLPMATMQVLVAVYGEPLAQLVEQCCALDSRQRPFFTVVRATACALLHALDVFVCVCMRACVYMCVHEYVCVNACLHVHVCACMLACARCVEDGPQLPALPAAARHSASFLQRKFGRIRLSHRHPFSTHRRTAQPAPHTPHAGRPAASPACVCPSASASCLCSRLACPCPQPRAMPALP